MAETGMTFESGQASLSLSEDDKNPKNMHFSDNEVALLRNPPVFCSQFR